MNHVNHRAVKAVAAHRYRRPKSQVPQPVPSSQRRDDKARRRPPDRPPKPAKAA